ncbi:MAG: LysE family translocator [Rhodobacteraceae bacterium]|nr:LysE family translocator [Paracoccaceae bacterium]
MNVDLWLAFTAASTALLLIPGPTVLLVLSYALSQGRRVAVSTAAGVATGDLIAMSVSMAGFGALIAASATAFVVLKWIGALYLVYLGLRLILSARTAAPLQATRALGPITAAATYRNAALVTALNPKSIGFFVAFVPQFIDPARPFVGQASVMIATFVALAAVNALAYALLADRLRARIEHPSVLRWLTRAGGATLIAMGALTATLRRAA